MKHETFLALMTFGFCILEMVQSLELTEFSDKFRVAMMVMTCFNYLIHYLQNYNCINAKLRFSLVGMVVYVVVQGNIMLGIMELGFLEDLALAQLYLMVLCSLLAIVFAQQIQYPTLAQE